MKTFKITEDQIKDISLGDGKTKIKEMFPSVFGPKETPEEFFNSIFTKDLIRKIDLKKYPNSQFYFDGDTLLLEIEKRDGEIYLSFSFTKIWSPLFKKTDWGYLKIRSFLKGRGEEHFLLSDVTPKVKLKTSLDRVEEHFDLRD